MRSTFGRIAVVLALSGGCVWSGKQPDDIALTGDLAADDRAASMSAPDAGPPHGGASYASGSQGPVRLAAYVDEPTEPDQWQLGNLEDPAGYLPPLPGGVGTNDQQVPVSPLPPPVDGERMPIDLPAALRLAGANHLQIALAAERVRQAAAELDQADVLWIPSLNMGAGYNRHDGVLQDTQGNIVNASRQSLYVGGGPALGAGAPLSGGAAGPARFFVDLSLSDILYQPLVARQNLRAASFENARFFNDSLLQVGLLHQELVRAYLLVEIAAEAVRYADQLAQITADFARAGIGLEADAQRARAERQQRRRDLAAAEELSRVVSAELGRLLRLDPQVLLVPVEPQPLALHLLPEDMALEELIAQGLTRRPELGEHQSRVAETLEQIRQEQWRPWLPHLFVGYAGAGFGGGPGSFFGNFSGRGDFDALAVWEWKNFGLGNRALQQQRQSQHRQASLQYQWIRDQVAAQIAQAYYQSTYRRQQIAYTRQQVVAAADAVPLNFRGIEEAVLRPIEAQQAIAALAAARSMYLSSVTDYNRAQLELLRAIGEPPTTTLEKPRDASEFKENP